MDQIEWWTTAQARTYLGVGDECLRRWRLAGRVPFVRIGNRIRFKRADIERLLADRT